MRKLLGLLCLLLVAPAFGQTISFTADVTQGNGQVAPALAWDTSPLADNCQASGDWSGAKGGAGSETLPVITSSATYNLTCTWSGAVTLSWTAPTQNTDGSTLTDLAGYNIYYGTQSGTYTDQLAIPNPSTLAYVIEGLASGAWYFVATAFNAAGVESDYSGEAMKTVADIDVVESVGIVVNPKPNPPGGLAAD